MCIGVPKTPDVPQVPDRQAAKLPDNGNPQGRTDNLLARRRALMATIFTSPNGTLGMPSVSQGGAGSTTLG